MNRKIPKGWHKLKNGTIIRTGDKFLSVGRNRWFPTQIGRCKLTNAGDDFYIRKNRRAKR
jgi:hypothetical protein